MKAVLVVEFDVDADDFDAIPGAVRLLTEGSLPPDAQLHAAIREDAASVLAVFTQHP